MPTHGARGLLLSAMLRFTTAGESHGIALVSILEGIPAGVPLLASDIDADLGRRQLGYGRGRRMQIESDRVEFLSGVRGGETIGSPIAMLVRNSDWRNWQEIMSAAPLESDAPGVERKRAVTRPRPGHADLAGMLKYDRSDARDILERASARETTARVAAGAACRTLLRQIGVSIGSHVVELGGVSARCDSPLPTDLNQAAELARLKATHGIAALWDAHSIRSVLPRFFEGKLPDLNLGTGNGSSCDPALAQTLLHIAEQANGYSAVLNGRFKGGHITRQHGNPSQGIHAVQLEMTQCSYMQEQLPFDYLPALATGVQPHVRRLLEAVLDFVEKR